MSDSLSHLASRLAAARSVVVITGAGISAESGLRTFRGSEQDMTSLWKEFDPQTLATPEAFNANPEMETRWYDWRRQGCLAAEPNAGHLALAELEHHLTGRGGRFTLLTQNVDRLHQKAGSVAVVELHGSIIEWRCTECGTRSLPPPEPFTRFPAPAICCGAGRALLRPDVVWFGEALPFEALREADAAVADCDVFFSIGTSSVVYPAAAYVHSAAENGATTVEVNKDPTPITRRVHHSFQGRAGEILPRLVSAAFGRD